jgi:hypothetical protein
MLATTVCLIALAGVQPAPEPVKLTPEQLQSALTQICRIDQIAHRLYGWYVHRFYPNSSLGMWGHMSPWDLSQHHDWILYLAARTLYEISGLKSHLWPPGVPMPFVPYTDFK